MKRLLEAGKLLLSGSSIPQSSHLYESGAAISRSLHEHALSVARQKHHQDLLMQKRSYLWESGDNLVLHFQGLDADLFNSSKEAERDMFDQKNRAFSTTVISATVMFNALSTVIFQGFLPPGTSSGIAIAYSLTSSTSFAFLFLSTVLSVEMIHITSKFMYRRTTMYQQKIMNAVKTLSPTSNRAALGFIGREPPVFISDSNVDGELKRHLEEAEIKLRNREKIIHELDPTFNPTDNTNVQRFEEFWNVKCGILSKLTMIFFYAGSVNLLLAIAIFMWARFDIGYTSLIGGICAVSLIGTGVIIVLCIVLVVKYFECVRRLRRGGEGESEEPLLDSSRSQYRGLHRNNSNSSMESNSYTPRNSELGHSILAGEDGEELPSTSPSTTPSSSVSNDRSAGVSVPGIRSGGLQNGLNGLSLSIDTTFRDNDYRV